MPSVDTTSGTKLVRTATTLAVFSSNCETDARTALTKALAEYVRQLEGPPIDQERGIYFRTVVETWAESEETAEYPGAAVYSTDEHTYDGERFTPSHVHQFTDGSLLFRVSELSLEINVDVYCNDPEQRVAVGKLLEDAFNPVEWMYGFILELPHYFNARASFELVRGGYEDSSSEVQRRLRKSSYALSGRLPVLRVGGKRRPSTNIRTNLTISE